MDTMERRITRPTRPSPQRLRQRTVMLCLMAGAVVVVLSSLAIIRYTSPSATVRSYLTDLLVNHDAKSGYALLCASTQAQTPLSQVQIVVDENKALAPIHLGGLSYTLVDENFFGDAHVRVSGAITYSLNGSTQKTPISIVSKPITLHTSGLEWCLTESIFSADTGLSTGL
jgi:hypothetical protein